MHTYVDRSCSVLEGKYISIHLYSTHEKSVRTYVCTYAHIFAYGWSQEVRMYVRRCVLLYMHRHTHSLSIHRLRMRLKALQQVIESQNVRLAELQLSGGRAGEVREDTSTGQCE